MHARTLYHIGRRPAHPHPKRSRSARDSELWERPWLGAPVDAGVFLTPNPVEIWRNHGVRGHVYAYRVPESVIEASGGLHRYDTGTEILIPASLWSQVQFLGKTMSADELCEFAVQGMSADQARELQSPRRLTAQERWRLLAAAPTPEERQAEKRDLANFFVQQRESTRLTFAPSEIKGTLQRVHSEVPDLLEEDMDEAQQAATYWDTYLRARKRPTRPVTPVRRRNEAPPELSIEYAGTEHSGGTLYDPRAPVVASVGGLPLKQLGIGCMAAAYTGPDDMVYLLIDDSYNDGARDVLVELYQQGVRHIPAIEVYGRVPGGTVYRMPKYETLMRFFDDDSSPVGTWEARWEEMQKQFPPSIHATMDLLFHTAKERYPRVQTGKAAGKPMQWGFDLSPRNIGIDPVTNELVLLDVIIGSGLIIPATYYNIPRRYNRRN